MLATHKLRIAVSKYALLETAFVIFGFILLGYWIEAKDPLLIEYEISYAIIVLAVITLFHGSSNGIFAIFLLAVSMKYFYTEFPIEIFLKLLVLTLVFGEFHHFWNRKISQNSSKNAYLNKKLDELSNAFYTLKISHDQLEKNYVFKPMSIRNSIRQLKEAYVRNQDYYKNFLLLLKKSFNVSDAEIRTVRKGKVYSIQDKHFKREVDSKDPMIQMALVKKTPIYVSSEEVENNSAYLAVVPVVSENKVLALLLIKDMPFMSFNKDNLISISIIISYFLDELQKWKILGNEKKHALEDDTFYYELMRLEKIHKEFRVNSTVLVIRSSDKLLGHLILEKAEENLRSLDMISAHEYEDKEVISILFPFADQASAQGFLTRLFKLLKLDEEEPAIEHSFFDISELQIFRAYSGVEIVDA